MSFEPIQPLAHDPFHVAVIMDGNGRWAKRRGLPRTAGHRAGAKAVRRCVEAAPDAGVSTLTLYAFSSDNWQRPKREVSTLMGLLEQYLHDEAERCGKEGVRLSVIGRRDRLSPSVVDAIHHAEATTADSTRLHLRIAVDYSARWAIARAATLSDGQAEPHSDAEFLRLLNRAIHSPADTPPVDLLIRTSGEKRLSDFLLWECAYSELVFLDVNWPDFDKNHLVDAAGEFRQRDRRFGRIAEAS